MRTPSHLHDALRRMRGHIRGSLAAARQHGSGGHVSIDRRTNAVINQNVGGSGATHVASGTQTAPITQPNTDT